MPTALEEQLSKLSPQGPGAQLYRRVTAEQQAALPQATAPAPDFSVEAIDARNAALAAQQQQLEAEHGKWTTAATQAARGALDFVLAPGALLGAGLESGGALTGWSGLEDFGRGLGKSANGRDALALPGAGLRQVFGDPDALDDYQRNLRDIAAQQEAWPMLSTVSHLGGLVAAGVATGGLSALASKGTLAATAAGRIATAAGVAGVEGAEAGAQAAYVENKSLRDVLGATVMGGLISAATGGIFQGATEGFASQAFRDSLGSFAKTRTFKGAVGGIQSDWKKVGGRTEVERLVDDVASYTMQNGEKVIPDKLWDAATLGREEIAQRFDDAAAEAGSKLGNMRRSVSEYIDENAPELRPDANELIAKIRKETLDAIESDPQLKGRAGAIRDVVDHIEQKIKAKTGVDIPVVDEAVKAEEAAGAIGVTYGDDTAKAAEGIFGRELKANDLRRIVGQAEGDIAGVQPKITTHLQTSEAGTPELNIGVTWEKDGRDLANIRRSFYRNADGDLVAHHIAFDVDESLQGNGIGSRAMARQLAEYQKLGVKKIELEATWGGPYIWSKAGFKVSDKEALKEMRRRFIDHVESIGEDVKLAKRAKTAEDIANVVTDDGATGKEFLKDYYNEVGEAVPMHLDSANFKKAEEYFASHKPTLEAGEPALKPSTYTETPKPIEKTAGIRKIEPMAPAAKDTSISLADLRDVQESLKKRLYPKVFTDVPAAKEELQRVERMIESAIEDTVDKALPKMGAGEAGAYRQLRRQTQSLIQAKEISKGALARSEGNRFLSLTDSLTGAAALAGDLAGGGGAFSAAKGLVSAGAHKLAREHGSQFLAALANKMSKNSEAVARMLGTASRVADNAAEAAESDYFTAAAEGSFGGLFGRVAANDVSIARAGGPEAHLAINELAKAKDQIARAVEFAGPNPEKRQAAQAEAQDRMVTALMRKAGAYDPNEWAEKHPNALQKLLYRGPLLDATASGIAQGIQAAKELEPKPQAVQLNPTKLRALTRDADGPSAIGGVQQIARDVSANAPQSVHGDAMRPIARKIALALHDADVPQAMAAGHELANQLEALGAKSPDPTTKSFAERQVTALRSALGSRAFGKAGVEYAKLQTAMPDALAAVADPARARDVLKATTSRGDLPGAVREYAESVIAAHEALRSLAGGDSALIRTAKSAFSQLEEKLTAAEGAVTLDGGPAGRVFGHFDGAPTPRERPEFMVLNAIRPQMERIMPMLGKGERGEKPQAALPKSQAELQSLYNERMRMLAEQATETTAPAAMRGVPNVPPDLATAVSVDSQQRIAQLLQDMPKPKQNVRGKAFETLSSSDLRKANAMWEATMQPMSVFADFQHGSVDYDKVSYAWKQFPGIQHAAQMGLLDVLHSHLSDEERAVIPDASLTQLDYLLGFNGTLQTSVNRGFSARVSAMQEQPKQQQPTAQLDTPMSEPTMTQRIAEGNKS